jgi:hypothetical protein
MSTVRPPHPRTSTRVLRLAQQMEDLAKQLSTARDPAVMQAADASMRACTLALRALAMADRLRERSRRRYR